MEITDVKLRKEVIADKVVTYDVELKPIKRGEAKHGITASFAGWGHVIIDLDENDQPLAISLITNKKMILTPGETYCNKEKGGPVIYVKMSDNERFAIVHAPEEPESCYELPHMQLGVWSGSVADRIEKEIAKKIEAP